MFIKPFRTKSQTQLKGSDRKRLRADLQQAFPSLSAEDVARLIPNKEDVILAKLYSNKGDSVNVYQVQKDPLFFMLEKEKQIYPTVYLLWKFPNLLHTFTTHVPVIDVLAGGADLMLPGIVIRGELKPNSYGKFEKGFCVAINTTDNKAPHAVGVTAYDSMDMFMAGRRGKGATIFHVYRDKLWEMGSKTPPPNLGPPDIMLSASGSILAEMKAVVEEESACQSAEGEEEDEEEEEGGGIDGEVPSDDISEGLENLQLTQEQLEEDGGVAVNVDDSLEAEESPQQTGPEAMDSLLLHCFLKAWKTSGKKIELPILTSNFYRLHMVPGCPDGFSLDVKKSSYKKLSKFLNAMAKKELIQVKEFPKGIENITAVNWTHEDLKNFVVNLEETTAKPVTTKADNGQVFTPPLIEEVNQVSGDTLPFFRVNGYSKGDVLNIADVRKVVTDYIKRKGLKKEGQNTVNLDPLLHETVVNRKEGYKETLRWDEVFSRMLGKMAPAVRITRHGGIPTIRKGKLEPIELAVAKRSGNKKVTLVYNASIYGIDEAEFAHQIQVGVAASTSVGAAEHKPQGTTQVLIQGNQVAFVSKLLLETYKIPRKYIRGMELAPKRRK